jgi:CRISPR/Cas system-associated exonuclease Cas4 (RecB family)
MIKTWSHSRETKFRECKLRAKLLFVDRLEEPRQPLRPGQTEYANDRGTRIHEAAELYIRGGVELVPELVEFTEEFTKLREMYQEGKVSLEGEWGFNDAWQPVGYTSGDVWLRVKLDALVHMDDFWAVVVDYKTGKKFGNEIKHAEQTQLYAVSALMRYPKLKRITTELWYPDAKELTRVEYTKEQALRFFRTWNERGLAVTNETEFPPNPNKYSCKWCMFGPRGSGVCKVGV